MDDAVEMLSGRRPVQPYSLVLTFDDGYRNNLTRAVPVLRRHQIPALIYLATGPIERREPFWFDRLDYALQQVAVNGTEIALGGERLRLHGKRAAMARQYRAFLSALKRQSSDDLALALEAEQVIKTLEAESGWTLADLFEEDEWSGLLTGEEITRAAGEGVTFGSHTVDHLRPFRLEADLARDQLSRSKRMVESWTGRPCLHFAYPFGKKADERDDTVDMVRACGYQSAVTTIYGLNRVGDDLMTLRRFPMPLSGHAPELLATVSGLLHAVTQFKTRFLALLW
jgi:peptidoglycan/xylan/chitin deacetylase (PgdA/CDA1 family)